MSESIVLCCSITLSNHLYLTPALLSHLYHQNPNKTTHRRTPKPCSRLTCPSPRVRCSSCWRGVQTAPLLHRWTSTYTSLTARLDRCVCVCWVGGLLSGGFCCCLCCCRGCCQLVCSDRASPASEWRLRLIVGALALTHRLTHFLSFCASLSHTLPHTLYTQHSPFTCKVLEVLHAHEDTISHLVWGPRLVDLGGEEPEAVLASSSADRRVRIWRSPKAQQQ